MAKTAEVWIWDTLVGAVLWDESQATPTGTFEFDPTFCKIGIELSPLDMPAVPNQVYAFPGLNPRTYKMLPPCLSDSLPDDFGNAVIDAWLAREGRDPRTFTPVERLLYIGARGMGALEFRPAVATSQSGSVEHLEMSALVDLAKRILVERQAQFSGLKLAPGNEYDDQALAHLFQVGSSAGGQRPKAIIALNEETGDICSGQLPAPTGYTHWLFKFDVGKGKTELGDPEGFGRVEFAYHRMALAAGVDMTECRLHEEGARAHFMTRRFDRLDDGDKVHVQTLCAMDQADFTLPGAYSYEQALQVARDLGLSRQEQIQFYRRAIFNVIARNQDDHTKNVAFFMGRDGVWRLTPAYDVCWSYRPDSEWVSSHQMTLNGKRDGFELNDLLQFGKQIPRFDAREVIREVAAAVSRWREFAAGAGVSDQELIEQIESSHRGYLAESLTGQAGR